jgi:CDP-2,3-bis-(O-geranylgeranyl)-sn-glycerol synthase
MVFYSNIFECAFLGFLLSSGALFGDMMGSFIKRRLGIKQGRPAPILDQLNFIFGALLFTYPFSPIPLDMIITICLITPIVHLTSNIIAYKLKIKKVWW